MPADQTGERIPYGWVVLLPLLLAGILVLLSQVHYLWFHSLAELFAVMAGITLYMVARASHAFNRNLFILFLAQGFFWAACIDILHTLTYEGMGLTQAGGGHMAPQLWLIARLLEAATLLLAPLYLGRRQGGGLSFWIMGAIALVGASLVFAGRFPAAFVEGQGLTPFKVATEYLIIAILLASGGHLYSRRHELDAMLFRVMLAVVGLTVASEFAFTLYETMYALPNLVGHVLKFWAFWLLLLVVFRWMLAEPFRALSRDAMSFDHLPIPVLVLDAQGTIQVANRRALDERPQGMAGVAMHAAWAPAGLPEADCPVCLAIAAGAALATEMHDPGRDAWNEVYLQPIRLGDAVQGFVCAQIDISARKRTELALQESNRQVRDLYDLAPCGYHSLNADGVIVNINQTELDMLGYRRDELVGRKRFADLLTQESRRIVEQSFPLFMERGFVHNLELEVVRKDGSIFLVNLNATAVRDDAGNYQYSRSTFIDITRGKRAEERLIQVEKAELVGQMAAGLAHDFNNLLGVIVGCLQMLGQDIENERSRRQIELASRAARRATEITRSLLAVARRQPLAPAEQDLRAVLAELMPLLRQAVGARIEVRESSCSECAAGLMRVNLDQAELGNALLNLAVNARDAMPNGGNLVIDTRYCVVTGQGDDAPANLAPGQYAVLAVTDNGAGMPRNVALHAFEPFFTTKPHGQGTGLGLAMVYGFARQSGGTAAVYSQQGVGTTIRLYLPVNLQGAPAGVRTLGPVAPGQGERILLVDDEQDLLDITHEWLLDLGYTVRCATSAAVALEILKREPFALLLTDVMMPGDIDGVALAGLASGLRPGLKAMLMSGFAGLPESGAWPRLAKPFTKEELARRVRALLDGDATTNDARKDLP
jgi:PAS domain S-box-containing protein